MRFFTSWFPNRLTWQISLSLARSIVLTICRVSLSLFYNVKYISVFWLRRARHFNLRRTLKTLLALTVARSLSMILTRRVRKKKNIFYKSPWIESFHPRAPAIQARVQPIFILRADYSCLRWSDKNLSICCAIKFVCCAQLGKIVCLVLWRNFLLLRRQIEMFDGVLLHLGGLKTGNPRK